MQTWMVASHKIVLALIVAMIGGCQSTVWRDKQISKELYVMYEGDALRHFYSASVSRLTKSAGDASSSYDLGLFETYPQVQDAAAMAKRIAAVPPSRRMSSRVECDLFSLAVYAVGGTGELAKNKTPIKYIISNEPLVIAITDQSTSQGWGWGGSVYETTILAGNYRLVTDRSLDDRVVELVIVDQWPPNPGSTSASVDSWFDPQSRNGIRRMVFDQPKSLLDVMKSRPWLTVSGAMKRSHSGIR